MTVPNNANTYLPGTITTPSSLLILAITQSYPMVITANVNSVTASNTYLTNQLIKLFIPPTYGMQQANGLVGQILSVNGLVFTVDLNSTYFDAFSVPVGNVEKPASFSPAGSRNLQYDNSNSNFTPFKSLNNRGN